MEPPGEVFADYILRSVQRVIDAACDLSSDQLAWRPAAAGTNSVGVIAVHVLANLTDNVLGVLGGEAVARVEFADRGVVADDLALAWAERRPRVESILVRLDDGALAATYDHPRRGRVTGLDVLIVAARHAAEPAAEAELTRSLCLSQHPAH